MTGPFGPAPTGPEQREPRADLPPTCAAVEDDLVELALGMLMGKQRVIALAHVEDCTRCSAEVEALSAAADQLVHLAPAAEPPVGFEARVFERLGLAGRGGAGAAGPTPRRVRRRLLGLPMPALAAAAVALLALAFGLGMLAAPGAHQRVRGPMELMAMHSTGSGRDVGNVLVYTGNPTWLFMDMWDFNWHGALRCQVTVDDGPPVTLGQFWLSGGQGAWAESVNMPAGRLVQARVLSASGAVLAVADLS
ncbi:MAG TPA: hypothetical protein VME46_16185 [Acidimicrobiales bacterium]|nr:hypothetical protein [Acidimicrobiales bacterium]